MGIEERTQDAIQWIGQAPPMLSALALCASALLEYIVPPFPGDTLILAGGVVAAQGALPLPALFLGVTLGSIAGAVVAWWIGRLARISERVQRLFTRFVSAERLRRLQDAYLRRGKWFVLGNRFFPGVRGTFLFVAGYAGMPLSQVLIYGSASALFWNACLLGAGWAVGANLDELFDLFRTYTTIASSIVGAIVVALVARALWRRLRPRAAS